MGTEKYVIEKLGMNGEGVARHNGKVVFIKGALPQETVLARPTLVKKSFTAAALVKVLVPSKDRVEPFCPMFFKCGGCSLQHLDYAAQLDLKAQTVLETLEKVGGIKAKIDKICPSPHKFRYRNKLSFPVRGEKVGLYSENTHDVADISDCLLQKEWNSALVESLRRFMRDYGFVDNDERHGLRHIVAREKNGSICVVLVTARNAKVSAFLDYIPFPDFALYQNINSSENNVILGDEYYLIGGKGKFPDFHPASFYQVNDEIEAELYSDVTALCSGETVVDAYCGAGNLTLGLARSASRVYGVEICKEAVDEAIERAKARKVDNVSFICGDCKSELPALAKRLTYEKHIMGAEKSDIRPAPTNHPDSESAGIGDNAFALSAPTGFDSASAGVGGLTVVLDPPRKGVDQAALEAVSALKPSKIIYVSCNPATLSRDLKTLVPDYEISRLNIYDMFPMTPHVETLVVLSRKNSAR